MDDSEENMSTGELSQSDSPINSKTKPKKRSLVERELETNLTDRVTSPITNGVTSTSRYGRARRLKTSTDFCDTEQAVANMLKSPKSQKSKSPAYKMHALNSPIKVESPILMSPDSNIENKIKSIYHENISLSRFAGEQKKLVSPSKKSNKIYVRKDLIQKQEKEETLNLIRNMFSPPKSSNRSSSHLNNILERSSDKYSLNITICNSEKKKPVNNHINNESVVKILDFDNNKKKKRDSKEAEKGKLMSKSELFEMEAKCEYQVGDLAWARMGTFPFWPCIVTREPTSGFFVKKKLFGRIEREIVHVTFFGDNGRRSWIVDNMLRKYFGELEFENTRDQFTAEAKKKDPKLYSAFFISEKKQPLWKHSVEEAEQLLKEPKRLRIDIFNNMLLNYRPVKNHRSEKVSRTNSDVSLSESLYDTLFSEDDGKNEESAERNRNKTKNKSLDVSEVVTACLDNMAAKTGITKIQKQSHMDRWLQKAKSKTPEKAQDQPMNSLNHDKKNSSKKKNFSNQVQKDCSIKNSKFRNKSSTVLAHQNEHNYSSQPAVTLHQEYDQSSNDSNLKFENGLSETSNSECSNIQADENNMLLSTDPIIKDLVVDSLKINKFEKIIELPIANGLPDNIMEDDDQMVVDEDGAPKLNIKSSVRNLVNNDTYNESQTFTEDVDVAFDLDTDKKVDIENINKSAAKLDESSNDVVVMFTKEAEQAIVKNTKTDMTKSGQTDKEGNVALNFNNKGSNLDDIDSLKDNITSINDKKCVHNNDTPRLKDSFSTNCSNIIENKQELAMQCNELHKDEKYTLIDTRKYNKSEINENYSCPTVNNEKKTSLGLQIHNDDPANVLCSSSVDGNKKFEPISREGESSNNTIVDESEVKLECISYKKKTSNRTLEVRLEKIPIDIHLQHSDISKVVQVENKEITQESFIENNVGNKEDKGENVVDSNNELTEKLIQDCSDQENNPFVKVKVEIDPETASVHSETSDVSNSSRRSRKSDKSNYRKFSKSNIEKALKNPEFVQYLEFKQDAIIEENPELSQEDIVLYLYNTWIYEESLKDDTEKADDIVQANLVKGLKTESVIPQKKIRKKKEKVEKQERELSPIFDDGILPKDKPKRKTVKPYYNEDYDDVDLDDEIQLFEIFRKSKPNSQCANKIGDIKTEDIKTEPTTSTSDEIKTENTEPTISNNEVFDVDDYDEIETYFEQLIEQKPNIFKGLIRDKVCEICETTGSLVRCKGCYGHFHVDCVKKQLQIVEVAVANRGRKKKKKTRGRKPKGYEETNGFDESHSDEKEANVSEENPDVSMEEIPQSHTVDAENFEAQLETKMKEILDNTEVIYDSSSDDEVTWVNTIPGKCEIVDVKPKIKQEFSDQTNFKCNDCETNETPLCFVCKSTTSKGQMIRQKCSVAHCNKYFHLSCLEHWPQTQFNSGNHAKAKQTNEHFETITCPRHVCHTCVSDDPRGCKTRFSGDKLARCVRCPATYHTFTKCLPAGSQILTGSHIICPRHYQHRPGKVPCHVNTGWCFICALGGSLICCEYCPTSFHAECLNIDPPEGGYMCEDCETGRLPLYGEMVWVKLGHYRWWPGLILHPSEIPDNIMAVKHSLGEFVVRFFGQYDHYWVNRGRVFPFQEGDSGKVSSQKSKIDEAFTMAMQHAHRAYEIMKSAQPNEEESIDIASSLLPPHYVKLRVNKPVGSLVGRRVDDETDSTTQCDCDPNEQKPCAPYTHCLNRMLLTECGPWCKAGDRCQNRAFERREYPKLVPYRTPHRGWGLKTLENIRQGQFVIEYVGELIDEEEFRRRMTRKHEMRDENFYFLTLDKERMIDAGPKGNLARFMNHSCEPNCETQKWTVLGDVRVGLFALVDIPANSEVTFNYNLECAGIDKKRCMCGAKRCSGYMGAKPKQEEPQPKKNKIRPAKRTYKKRKNIEISPSTSAVKKSPKPRLTTRSKPRELTEIEKDLLIIKNATNGISSDSESDKISLEDKTKKPLKRKRVSFSTEEVILYNSGTESPSVKKIRVDCEKNCDVGG